MTDHRSILHRLRPALYGAAVVGLVGVMGIGIAAPAEAFSPGGWAPEPVMTSTELAGLGGTAAEGATTAGAASVEAFAPVAPLAVAFGGFRIGFSAVGMALAPFGIDNNKNVCELTGGAGGPIGNTAVNLLTGADCNMYKVTEPATTLNADAPAGTAYPAVGTVFCKVGGSPCAKIYHRDAAHNYYCVSSTTALSSGLVYVRMTGSTTWGGSAGWRSSPLSAVGCGTDSGALAYDGVPDPVATPAAAVSWYSDGSNSTAMAAPTTSTNDPTRHWECDVTGSDGTVYSATSADFTWGTSSAGTPAFVCPKLPAGVLPAQTEVDLVTPSLNPPKSVWLGPITPTQAFTATAQAYPECATSSCHLQVWTTAGQNCANAGTCADWFADPNKASNYACHYGTHVVDLAECNVMSSYYDPQKQASGQAYADPATGAPVTQPDPSTGVETPVQTSPKAGDAISTEAPQDAPTRGDCWPSGWGVWNPLNWVLQPIQCGWEWATVARPEVVKADMERIDKGPATKMPAQIIGVINAWHINTPASDCSGLLVPAMGTWFPAFRIMQACPGDMLQPVAFWTRIFCDLGFAVLGFRAITRHIGRIVQYGGVGE